MDPRTPIFTTKHTCRGASIASRHLRARLPVLAALLIGLLVLPFQSTAAEITWFGPSGSWSNAGSWWPNQVPQQGDVVWVKAPNGTQLQATYTTASGPWIHTAHFDSVGSGLGTVLMSQGLLPVGVQNVGLTGRGAMSVTGGTHWVGDLNLAFWGGSQGTYALSGAGALQANRVFVGNAGNGQLTHSAGTATIAGDLNLGFWRGAYGRYDISGTAALSANRLFVGGGGKGVFTQDSGSVQVAGDIALGLLGGSNGTYDLTGPGAVACHNLFVGSAQLGRFTQSAGVTTVRHDLVVGNLGGSNGTYVLSGAGSLTAVREYVGGFGVGRFEQTGGHNDIVDLLQIGVWGGAVGTYELSGSGSLEVGTIILGGFGRGHFVQSGGVTSVLGGVRIAELPNSLSTLSLEGGSFSAAAIWNKAFGSFDYTGGTLAANSIVNDGSFSLGGAGVRLVGSPVVNNGTMEVTETIALFDGTLTNRGAYLSAQSDNGFTNLVIDQNGYVIADGGSVFVLAGDLLVNAPTGLMWDTTLADLMFVASDEGEHLLRVAGQDLGASYDGYVDNFAWKSLSLVAGESLELQGGALYVRVLDLADGLAQLDAITSNGIHIYYDVEQTENAYLDGETHALAGGGAVIPVPEPGAMLSISSGIAALGLIARRRARAKSAVRAHVAPGSHRGRAAGA